MLLSPLFTYTGMMFDNNCKQLITIDAYNVCQRLKRHVDKEKSEIQQPR
jgi:hypothetical protein